MTARHSLLTTWEPVSDWHGSDPVCDVDPMVSDAVPVRYTAREWTSPVVQLPFAATQLVPSWNARTPAGAWLLVEARVRAASGWSAWLQFARWTEGSPEEGAPVVRTSVRGQRCDVGSVHADVFVADGGSSFDAWQLRLTSRARGGVHCTVSLAAGCASAMTVEASSVSPMSFPASEIAVPPLSQRRHVDTFPQWDSGGQSWCSATSTAMLLEYWGVGPTADQLGWVGHDTDPQVVHAVRAVFDESFGGAGNWAFNVAHAGARGLRGFVTRLRDLTEAESFIAAGIPLIVAASFREDELTGAGYDTDGHLLTIIGFTETGDVISNDPNSRRVPSNDVVRTVYDRAEFERVWLGRDGGLAYVVHPSDVALPPPSDPAEPNW